MPFKIMYLFTGNSDTMLFQVMKDDRAVNCAQCCLGPQLLQTELVNILYYTCVVVVVLCVDCCITVGSAAATLVY